MIGKTIAELTPGDRAELTRGWGRATSPPSWRRWATTTPCTATAPTRPATPFKEPIAPGIYTAGLISAVIGTQLPGPGAIYLSQSLKFVKPVKVGDRITARVEIVEVIRERNRLRLQTVCVNQDGEEVLSGEAWVMPSRTRVVYEGRPASAAGAGRAGAVAVGVGGPGGDSVEHAVAVDAGRRDAPPELTAPAAG